MSLFTRYSLTATAITICSHTVIHLKQNNNRAPDKVRIFIYVMHISSPNPMFDNLLELLHRDGFNKWSNVGFGEEITQVE